MQVKHPFKPIYNKNSKVLILGSFPSVKSREEDFYYAHPNNRFWKIISYILQKDFPLNIEEKKQMLLEGKIAIWDVLEQCEITGSSDASIKNPIVNDIYSLVNKSNIKAIFFNGKKSFQIFNKFCTKKPNVDLIYLPSTSPANAAFNFDKLCVIWKNNIIKFLVDL